MKHLIGKIDFLYKPNQHIQLVCNIMEKDDKEYFNWNYFYFPFKLLSKNQQELVKKYEHHLNSRNLGNVINGIYLDIIADIEHRDEMYNNQITPDQIVKLTMYASMMTARQFKRTEKRVEETSKLLNSLSEEKVTEDKKLSENYSIYKEYCIRLGKESSDHLRKLTKTFKRSN